MIRTTRCRLESLIIFPYGIYVTSMMPILRILFEALCERITCSHTEPDNQVLRAIVGV